MFGSTLPKIFDGIHSALHQTIQDKVSTLPIIQHDDQESCETMLYSKISKVYARHMDMAQLYAENELFRMDKNYSRKKREKIVNAFLALEQGAVPVSHGGADGTTPMDNEKDNDKDNDKDKDIPAELARSHDTNINANEAKFRYTMPSSAEDIPTTDQVASLDDEIASLRKQLREIQVLKQSLNHQLQSIGNAEKSTELLEKSMTEIIGDEDADAKLLESVANAKDGKEALSYLSNRAEGLIKEVDEINDQKPKSNETEEFGEAMKAAALEASRAASRPKKKMTLEEDYQARKGSTNISGDVMKMFKKWYWDV